MRYYESIGLIPEPSRSSSGYRKYPEETIGRIRFIKNAQDLGFTLEEVRRLLYLADSEGELESQDDLCSNVREVTEEKIEEIENKIKQLQKLRKALKSLVKKCCGREKKQKCPIIDSLGNQ